MYSHLVSSRLRRLVLVTAVLPLVVLIGLRSAWAAYACRIDGDVRDTCCCPKSRKTADAAATDEPPRMAAACCCDVTSGESADAPQAREVDRLADFSAPALVAQTIDFSIRALTTTPLMRHSLARPPPPVPAYLAKRAILR